MGPPPVIALKDKDRDKLLDGSGITLEATTKAPTIRTGMDQGIAHNPLDHIFLPKMTMQWTCPLSSIKQPMTKNAKSTASRDLHGFLDLHGLGLGYGWPRVRVKIL